MRRRDNSFLWAFIDVLGILVLVGYALLALASTVVNEPTVARDGVETRAEFLISSEWDQKSLSDVDIWVRAPNGQVVSYTSKNPGLMSLDVDDLGGRSDFVSDGVVVESNREVVSIKAILPGEYVVNLHYYRVGYGEKLPLTVKVKLVDVNPYSEPLTVEVPLDHQGQEATAFSFVVDESGSVVSTSRMPRPFIYRGSN
jgi:hypothetical protein